MPATKFKRLGDVKFKGDIASDKNVSALAVVNDFLVIGADEGGSVLVLERAGKNYKVLREVILDPSGGEIDIEGIDSEDNTVYVVGSHSRKRQKADRKLSCESNLKRIAIIHPEQTRQRLYGFRLDSKGNASDIKSTSLMPAIEAHPILSKFTRLPSKENGVDIEGLAVHDGQLFVGFRGPILRENYVPILTCRFGDPVTHVDWLFINLNGLGVRDLLRVRKGFLVLAGPMGDGPGAYQLWFWNGKDCLPGIRSHGQKAGKLKLLGDVPMRGREKAEGIALLNETDSSYELLMVFDGLDDGGAVRFLLKKADPK